MEKSKEAKIKEIMKRKEEHIHICLEKNVESKVVSTLFEDVRLVNNSLPEINFDEIDTSVNFLGHKFSAPIMVGAMTGGAELAKKINKNLAEACEELGLGMVVGSQRAALYDKILEETYSIARKHGPSIFLGANIGAAQLSKGLSMHDAKSLVEMLKADALYVHLNPTQEIVQPEGDPTYANVLSRIGELAESVDKPVVAKEVGCGISGEVAKKLEAAGVSAVEVAGTGGTSYSAVEYYRAIEYGNREKAVLGKLFWDWGIPTAAALIDVRRSVRIPVVSSGGLRNGLEVAKSIALGASLCAMAKPLLGPASDSSKSARMYLESVINGLKATMFLTGSKNIEELGKARYIIIGELAQWAKE